MPFVIAVCLLFSFRANSGELPRKILAFSSLNRGEDVVDTPAHLYAEVILNHLGMEVVHQAVQNSLPPHEVMEGFRGILSWYQSEEAVGNRAAYCAWLDEEMRRGRKVVLLDHPGFFREKQGRLLPECERMLGRLGLRYGNQYSDNPFFMEVVRKEPRMVEFERKFLLTEGLVYNLFRAVGPQARVWLKMKRRDLEGSDSDLVVTTPSGGFAYTGTVHRIDRELGKVHWRLNPFLFFEEAFGLKGWPRPDTTTLYGRRIFFSHIDGDGVVNRSHIDNERYSGEVIREEILAKYPQIPVTASLITGYFDIRAYRTERVWQMYAGIFSLPNVMPAAHGHGHPLFWSTGKLAVQPPGYRYSDEAEITGSVERINRFLKERGISKGSGLFLWTGDCRPDEGQLSLVYRHHLLNMNGGDSRMDRRHDSYSFLSPLGILRGRYRQIYAPAANEHPYTNKWEGPYYGFRDVLEAFERTESPVRVKPVDVYYHFYSGETYASLRVLKDIYDAVLKKPFFGMFVADYVPIVEDFFRLRILSQDGGHRILSGGFLGTIRYDREGRFVDLERSRGVAGFGHYQGSLYVFLDDSGDHRIFLTPRPPRKPHIRSATFRPLDLRAAPGKISFRKKGWHLSQMEWGGMRSSHPYRVTAGGKTTAVRSDAAGNLFLRFPSAENGAEPVPVEIAP